MRSGRVLKGEAHGKARLTEEFIRKVLEPKGKIPKSEAYRWAVLGGVTVNYIYQLRCRKRWKHVK